MKTSGLAAKIKDMVNSNSKKTEKQIEATLIKARKDILNKNLDIPFKPITPESYSQQGNPIFYDEAGKVNIE